MRTIRGRVLGLSFYPESAAGTRYRLTFLRPFLQERGIDMRFASVLNDVEFSRFYTEGSTVDKVALVAKAFGRFLTEVARTDADVVFLQRGLSIAGPPILDRLLSLRRVLVFDFDDAIWLSATTNSTHPLLTRLLKRPENAFDLLRTADLVVAGSEYLALRAAEYNNRVHIAPTVVSRNTWSPAARTQVGSKIPTVGWIGTHSTAPQLTLAASAIAGLQKEMALRFVVRGAGERFTLPDVKIDKEPWRWDTEVADFANLDVGLAPMFQGPIYEGKCGFKQLQYMAVGVPQVCSMVGGARDFVVGGETAIVPTDEAGWYDGIRTLVTDRELRRHLVETGRRLVCERYCSEEVGPRLAAKIADYL